MDFDATTETWFTRDVPDEGASALLVLDVINDFEFAGTDKLLKYASAVVPKLTALKVQARGGDTGGMRQRQLRPMDFRFPPNHRRAEPVAAL